MDDDVRYAIIGTGLMGIEHIQNLLAMPQAKVTAIADTFPASISAGLETFKTSKFAEPSDLSNVHIFETSKDLLKTRDLFDVVVIATPNNTHIDVLEEVLLYGDSHLNILIEKPLCTTISDCRSVMKKFKSHEGLVWVGMEYRYMAPIAKVLNYISRGKIGCPIKSSIREHRFPFLEKVRNWNRFSHNTGGTFVEKCCHFWDLFNRFFKPAMPKRVLASASQALNHLDEVYDGKVPDILDNGFVIVEYSNGAKAMLDLCMFAESSLHQEEVTVIGSKGKVEALIPQYEFRFGERGTHSLGEVEIETVKDERVKFEGYHSGASYAEHLDILRFIKNGGSTEGLKQMPVTLWEGFLAVAVGVAAHQSLKKNRWVRMDEILTQEELSQGMMN